MKSTYFLFIGIFYFSTVSSAQQCTDLFGSALGEHKVQILSKQQSNEMMAATKTQKNSTTSDRTEKKYTDVIYSVKRALEKLKQTLESENPGFVLEKRDPETSGKKNVTWTAYSNLFKISLPGFDALVTAKIRVRKYGFVGKDQVVTKANFEVAEFMKDKSYFEFKIKNPEYENSVKKPRILILDADADALLNPNLSKKEYKEIMDRTITMNKPKDPASAQETNDTVFAMLKAVRGIHKKNSRFVPEYETLYERTSYAIPVKIKSAEEKFEIQITLDEDIESYSLMLQQYSSSYANNLEPIIVTEVKIPIPLLAYMNSAKINEVHNLKAISDFIDLIAFNSLKKFEDNSGKLFHTNRDMKRLKDGK